MTEFLEDYFKYTVCASLPAGRKRLRFIVDSIRKRFASHCPSETNILDYGCGSGYITTAIGSLGYNIVGIDIDYPSIEFAHDKNSFDNVQFFHIENQLGLIPDFILEEKCDVVISSEVLRYTIEPQEYLHSARKCLNENGILVLTDENGWGPREILGRFERSLLASTTVASTISYVRKKLRMVSIDDRTSLYAANPHIQPRHYFSTSSIRRLFLNQQFEIVKQTNSFFLFAVFGLAGKGKLDQIDSGLANHLPSFMASGWYFILKPTSN